MWSAGKRASQYSGNDLFGKHQVQILLGVTEIVSGLLMIFFSISSECWNLALLVTCFMLVSYLAYSSTLKMATCSSKTPVDFQRTTQRYIPKDTTLLHSTKTISFIIFYSPFIIIFPSHPKLCNFCT
jgi:hypothetical protein